MAISVSRRSDGLQHSHTNSKHTRQGQQHQQHQQQKQQQQQQQQEKQHLPSPTAAIAAVAAVSARMKRPLDPIDNLSDPSKAKRTRIAVEIFTRPLALGPSKPLAKRPFSNTQQQPVYHQQQQQQHYHHGASPQTNSRPSPTTTAANPSPHSNIPPPLPASAATTTTTTITTAPPPPPPFRPRPCSRSRPPQPSSPPPTRTTTGTRTGTSTTTTTATSNDHGLPKHKEKVINGIRHELDRLQPTVTVTDAGSAAGPPGRKLRSQEATRFKSELAAYFPEYDEVIGNDPKEQHLLNADTPIIILDTKHESSDAVASNTAVYQQQNLIRPELQPEPFTVRVYGDYLFTQLSDSPVFHFDCPETEHIVNDLEDPLPDSQYAPAHRKAERLEKSIRNTERGRAQHEKDQIIRLLGELQGHDWLRTMGVNGVTESRRKSFEPARDHFIKGCQTILEKFRLWSQEEKRRKLERERARAEETDDSNDDDTVDEEDDEEEEEGHEEGRDNSSCSEDDVEATSDVEMGDTGNEGDPDGDEPVEYSDVDAAARQLHDEAMARAKYATLSSPGRTRGEPPPAIPDPAPREFTSFFKKRHQRDAALNKGRRRGRTILAWGQPVPEMGLRSFTLPDVCLDEDTLRTHERQKRRDRRQRKQ